MIRFCMRIGLARITNPRQRVFFQVLSFKIGYIKIFLMTALIFIIIKEILIQLLDNEKDPPNIKSNILVYFLFCT